MTIVFNIGGIMEYPSVSILYWAFVALGGLLVLTKALRYGSRPKNYPPGPPTLPILGNLHQMPTKNFHLEFQKLAQEYGPITTMKLGGQSLFLLNDPDVIRDLLEKRSNNYSCRPDLYARHFGDNLNIALRDNDEIWRRQRKMYHVRLNVKSADRYLPYQHFDSLQLLNDFAINPGGWVQHVQRYTASISTTLLYGWRTPQTSTGYVKDLLEWMDVTSEAINFQLVDFYPFLRDIYHAVPYWLLPSKRKLHNLQKLENRVFIDLLNRAKDKLSTGDAYPSFIRDMLSDKDSDRLNDRQIANNAAHGFGAAMDTSANTILGFIKAMVLFPDVQAKAQKELDAVIGSGRLPTWDDRAELPYIRAPSPLSAAVPHSAKEDDVYNGMVIPKGSMIMINVWTLNHQRFANARDFDPMRHSAESTLTENNAITQDSPKRLHFTFGAGRRVCPGFHVAERNLFIAISRILWGFNISRARDADGEFTIINRDAVTPGMIVRPEDFECTIKPRDYIREKLVKEQWQAAEKDLDSEGNFTPEFIQASFK
ncbi:cytochrome P450 [Ilyonectria robusta]|uniref:cytochrome P450 n=1 Tax=Ilyonectria robusta TaxID=1079257 RepID=UPI001E8CB462|nr:cytochrome P450 [Ilyonectria robusta]KAH8721733.1 cytochrome P450 [Ilyonectria robusta]